jgi:hypothetical protein
VLNTNSNNEYSIPGGKGPYAVSFPGTTDPNTIQFLLEPNSVSLNFIPRGVWNMNLYVACSSSTFARNYIYWNLYYNIESTPGTRELVSLGTSVRRYLTNTIITEYSIENRISTRFLNSQSKQLFIKIWAGADEPSTDTLTFYFSNTYPSNIQTSVPFSNLQFDMGKFAIGKSTASYPLDIS